MPKRRAWPYKAPCHAKYAAISGRSSSATLSTSAADGIPSNRASAGAANQPAAKRARPAEISTARAVCSIERGALRPLGEELRRGARDTAIEQQLRPGQHRDDHAIDAELDRAQAARKDDRDHHAAGEENSARHQELNDRACDLASRRWHRAHAARTSDPPEFTGVHDSARPEGDAPLPNGKTAQEVAAVLGDVGRPRPGQDGRTSGTRWACRAALNLPRDPRLQKTVQLGDDGRSIRRGVNAPGRVAPVQLSQKATATHGGLRTSLRRAAAHLKARSNTVRLPPSSS